MRQMSRVLGQLVAGTGAMLSLLAPAQAQTGGGPSGEWAYSVVKAFESSPGAPKGRLHQGSDGALYGTTPVGGPRNGGALFKVNPDGTGFAFLLKLGNTESPYPRAGVIQGADSALYGTSPGGGIGNPGTVYRVNTDGTAYTILKQFTSTEMGYDLESGLIQGIDGALYGTTTGGGASGAGTVFKVNPDGTGFTTLVSFDNTNGASPYSGLIQGLDGALYGTTAGGGTGSSGTVFRVNADGTGFATLVNFDNANGARPFAGLVQGSDGVLYGTTREGGSAYGTGTVFRVNPDGTGFATIVTFDNAYSGGVWGTWPQGDLVLGPDGALYGTTQSGGYQTINSTIQPARGTVFRVNTDGTGLSTILTFTDPTGAYPYSGLTLGADGALYGMTEAGGAAGQGTVFRLNRDGSGHTILASFNGTGGSALYAGVIEGQDGYLYGTTNRGGSANQGTLFRVRRDGSGYAVLLSFQGATGVKPQAGLVQGLDGALYGTTSEDGSGYSAAGGTVFKVNPDGTGFTVLHSFTASTAQYGWQPVAAVTQGSDGVLYGTTSRGGTFNYGTVFRLNADGSGFASLASFDWPSGVLPQGALVQGTDGALYGTTNGGGALGHGTVFRLNANGTGFAPILNLDNSVTGGGPFGALLEGSDGAFYGTAYNPGTVFKVNPDGSGPALVAMLSPAAIAPYAGLIRGPGGALYGTTLGGGASNAGTVFTVNADGTGLAVLASFSDATGASPLSALVLGSDGSLYGTTFTGGPLSGGVVFRLTPPNPPAAQVAPASLDFGTQAIGSASAGQAVNVTNTGGETLSVTGATATGDFQATSGCATSLGAGASCTIQVAFAPSALGARTGTLTVTTTAGGPFAVGLTGTGASVPPPITIAAPVAGVTWTVGGSQAIAWTHGLGAAATFDLDVSRDGGPWRRIATAVPAASATTGSYAWTVTPVATIDARIRVSASTGATGVSDSFSIQLAATLDLTYEVMAEFAIPERYPIGALVQASDGNYYGSSAYAGASNIGSIFRMTPSGVLTDLYSITSSDGPTPYGGLTEGPDGAQYGTTAGELTGSGSLFRITLAGAYTKLSAFPSGATPQGWLTLGPDGAFYGTTKFGGANGQGSVYRATTDGTVTDVYSFTGGQDGGHPIAGLTLATDGALYGTTIDGGQNGYGIAFRITLAGDITRLHDFALPENRYAHGGLIEGSDGNFYGTTVLGGPTGNGSVYRMTPSGAVTVLHHFTNADGVQPYGRLVQGDDGAFYGTAYLSGTSGVGTAFRITRDGVFTVVHPFATATGGTPFAPLIRGNDGALYGMASVGGSLGGGVIYRLGPARTTPTITWPAPASIAYGTPLSAAQLSATASVPGTFAYTPAAGTVLPAGSYALQADFTPTDALHYRRASATVTVTVAKATPTILWANPADIVEGTALDATQLNATAAVPGAFSYTPPAGTVLPLGDGQTLSTTFTPADTANFEAVVAAVTINVRPLFRVLSPTVGFTWTVGTQQTITWAHGLGAAATFDLDVSRDGGPWKRIATGVPAASATTGSYAWTVTPVATSDARIRVTSGTGTSALSDSFSIELASPLELTYEVMAEFPLPERYPVGALVQASDGNYYGASAYAGASNIGAIFRMTPAGVLTDLYSITPADGPTPYGGLTEGPDGALYGTTAGELTGSGSLFRITLAGAFTRLSAFPSGATPQGWLTLGPDGAFYGTTKFGGANGQGSVYRATTDGTVTDVYSFTGGQDGGHPIAGLTLASDGTLYGTTIDGGQNGFGTAFRMTLAGDFTRLHDFALPENKYAHGGLIEGSDGNFYGTTVLGGPTGNGSVYRMTPSGAVTVLHHFTNADGVQPYGRLVQGDDGSFYGTAYLSGASGVGTAFRITRDGVFTVLHSFATATGGTPFAPLIRGDDGALYGMASVGGSLGGGVIYRLGPPKPAVAQVSPTALDFGALQVGATSAAQIVTLQNTGTGPLAIAGIVASGDFASTNDCPATLGAGASCSINVTFTPAAAGARSGAVTVTDNAAGSPHVVTLSGQGVQPPALAAGPTNLDFGGVRVGQQSATQTVTITNTGGGVLILASATATPAVFGVASSGCSSGLVSGASCVLGVTFTPSAAGDVSGSLSIQTNAGLATVALQGTGTQPAVSLSPTSLDFGSVDVGSTSAPQTVTLQNTGTAPLMIGAITATGEFARTTTCPLAPASLAVGDSCSIQVTLTPTAEGARAGTLSIAADAAGSPQTLSLGGAGVAAVGTWEYTIVRAFSLDPTYPVGTLVRGVDGALYGTTQSGGASDYGTVFKVNPDGSGFTTLVDFDRATKGGTPQAGVVQGSDGALYGTTQSGGASDYGTVFKLNPDGSGFTTLVDFDRATKGGTPQAGVVQGSDGALYGTTQSGGASGYGTVFKVNPDGSGFTTLVDFDRATKGGTPQAGVVQGLDGALYGTTPSGGASGYGTVFKVNPDGSGFTTLVDFDYATKGGTPLAGVVQGSDGALYGTTQSGGASGYGTVFKVNPDRSGFTTLVDFDYATKGGYALAGVVQGSDGALYGTTQSGGASGYGTVFKVNPDGSGFTTLVDFDYATKGGTPQAGVVQGLAGVLYGTTYQGGASGYGTVFKVNPDGSGFTTLVDFERAAKGGYPRAGVVPGSDGALYGTTNQGGAFDHGTVFKVNPDGSGFTTLVDFDYATKGGYPQAGVVQGSDGALYGTTQSGGASGYGTVFKVNPDGSGFTTLVDFDSATKGGTPQAGVVQGSDGALYGTTYQGGASGYGTVFKVNPDGSGFTTLVDFDNATKGGYALAGVVQGSDGALYGTTYQGGASGYGTVFKVNPDRSGFTTLVDFDNATKGGYPQAGVVQGSAGALYGTTHRGGASGYGTVFKVNPDRSGFTTLVDFAYATKGGFPRAGVVQGSDGALYGTTYQGVASGCGTVFKINPDGDGFTTLVDFDCVTKGGYPHAGVVQSPDGALYGTTEAGGPGGGGVVFRLRRRGLATAQVVPGVIALGSVNVGSSSAQQAVTVTNTGSGTVNVTAAAASGDFPITNGCTAGLGSDASCTIQVAFQPIAVGPRTGTLTVSTDAGGPFTVSLTGTGTAPAVTLAPTTLDFGSAEIGATTAAQSVALQNTGTGPVAIAGIVASGDFASTNDCPATLGAGASCSLTVIFTPTAVGTRSGAVTVTDDATGSPHAVTLSGQGTQPPAVAVAPSSLAFGAAVVGQTTSAQTATVTNTGGGTLTVTGAAATGDFQVTNGCTAGIGAGASCGVQVRFSPAATGARTGVLTITTNAGGPQTVALSGTGTAPVAALTPASLAFGALAVGVPSAPKTATLANTGDGPLTIASIVTTGDYAFASACPIAPATLPPGGTCTITVTFTAAATGSRPGTLRVTDNASGSPRTVNLTGTGAVVSVSPTSLAFGSVPLQTTSAAKTVTVNNSTLGSLPISAVAITTLASDYAQTNNCPATLASGATCVVTVTFKPTVAGSRAGQLRISYGASAVNVGLSGTGTFNLGVSPASLTFAKQALGTTSAAKTVTLTNGTGSPIDITGITSVGEFPVQSNTCGASLAAGTTCTFTVAFTPSAAGTRTGQVTIADNATGNPHKVNLTGTGTIPLTVAPASLGFGSVIAGVTSAAKTVTLTNSNPVAITFASITGSGDYALANGCPVSMDPNTSCTLSVTFTPPATGTRPATLDILSDATSSPQKVNLTGAGTLPLNTSGNLAFGSVVAGVTSAAKTITLTNPSPLLPITIASIVPTGDYGATDNCAGSIAPSGSCTLSVAFTPTAAGARSGSVVITSNATNNPRTSTLTGTGTLPLTVSPTSVAFGNQAINTTSSPKTVTLTNASPLLAIPITNVALTGTVPGDYAQTNNCGSSIPAGGSCTVTLTFRPTATGARAGQLTITSGATASPNNVNLSGRGI